MLLSFCQHWWYSLSTSKNSSKANRVVFSMKPDSNMKAKLQSAILWGLSYAVEA